MTDDVDDYILRANRRNQRWAAAGSWASLLALLAFIVGVCFVQCNGWTVDEDPALEAAKSAGMTDVRLDGRDFMACEHFEESRHFEATNAHGAHVDGTVCCGIVAKGCTIRWGR